MGGSDFHRPQLMFAGWSEETQTAEQTQIELMAHGGTTIEIQKANGAWAVVAGSQYGRRITLATEIEIVGPAAGHDRLKTNADPTGTRVLGTLNNCAGGKTPWGTVLMAEENFHQYFGGALPDSSPEAANYKRYGVTGEAEYPWHRTVERFDLAKEPKEPNRFGWIVEYDPYDPAVMPKKHTALGRFKHEGATSLINKDGRLVLYSGDDERFDYLYKYVSKGTFDPAAGAANSALLDDGTLYVAKFDEDKLTWLPLVHGEGPLTAENGFASQADVLIGTRLAADLVGATPMDRPEDVEPNPVNGRVYVNLTNNSKRKADQVDGPNPRPENEHGQVLELIPPGGEGKDADHAATEFGWEMLLLAGDPEEGGLGGEVPSRDPGLDLLARQLRNRHPGAALDRDRPGLEPAQELRSRTGSTRATSRATGARCSSSSTPARRMPRCAGRSSRLTARPCSSPRSIRARPRTSTFENPSTRWPDFKDGVPPRPSVVVITKDDGGVIGG